MILSVGPLLFSFDSLGLYFKCGTEGVIVKGVNWFKIYVYL